MPEALTMAGSFEDVCTAAGISVRRLQPAIGAEIDGAELARPLAPKMVAALRACWLKYKVIFFRDQHLTREQHIAAARSFGTLDVHPVFAVPGYPELVPITGTTAVERWHADVTYLESPPIGAMLRDVTLPLLGGDTVWANASAAYEGLDADIKERIATLKAVHSAGFERSMDDPVKIAAAYERNPPREHPIVRVHPETGEKVLYVNSVFTSHIAGLPNADSKELLYHLRDQFKRPEYQVRFTWRSGSVAFWDNRATQHYAVPDYVEPRYMERATLAQ